MGVQAQYNLVIPVTIQIYDSDNRSGHKLLRGFIRHVVMLLQPPCDVNRQRPTA